MRLTRRGRARGARARSSRGQSRLLEPRAEVPSWLSGREREGRKCEERAPPHSTPESNSSAAPSVCHPHVQPTCNASALQSPAHLLIPVAAVHAALINSATPSTPSLFLTDVNSVGPWSRILSASRFITSSDAPTYCAMSICKEEGGPGG